jgi:hypothetical protein
MKIVKAANLIMWCHELKRTCSAASLGSRVINPGFLRVVVTPSSSSPRQSKKSNAKKGKAKTEESKIMSKVEIKNET